MITTAIIWAITSTVGVVVVYLLMRRQVRLAKADAAGQAIGWEMAACAGEAYRTDLNRARNALAASEGQMLLWKEDAIRFCNRADDLEDKLRAIEIQRHNSAKKARAIQLERQRTVIAARKAELDRGIAAQTDRVAA